MSATDAINTPYRIHPAIGFARVGNSPDAWYLEPTEVGGLPTERDDQGHEQPVTQFKHGGQIKRQAARFRIYRHEVGQEPVEVNVGEGIRSIKWSVHVANKKAAWYQFQELQGDVMLGENNSYMNQGVPLRNPKAADRQKLIIDPGPRTLTQPGDWVQLDAVSAGDDYPHVSFPSADLSPYPITTLGAVRMTERGDSWCSVATAMPAGLRAATSPPSLVPTARSTTLATDPCTPMLKRTTARLLRLNAWVVSGAPKLAPELVNIASLADTFIDVGVRLMGLCPALFAQGAYQPDYSACLERDILPIFSAMKEYRWVANVDAMVSIATPPFHLSDLSEENRRNREAVFAMFRNPGNGHYAPEQAEQHQQLFAAQRFPTDAIELRR